MNEDLINDMANECGISIDLAHQINGDKIEIYYSEFKKFAELIVRECSNLCHAESTKCFTERIQTQCNAENILTHFGLDSVSKDLF